MFNTSFIQQLTFLTMLITSIGASADPLPRDDCDLGTSTAMLGFSPWISIDYSGQAGDETNLIRGDGCEIQINLNQPNSTRHQFAFAELSRQEDLPEQYEVHFFIEDFSNMLSTFKNQQQLKFFTLRSSASIRPGHELLSLTISKPYRGAHPFWKFTADWNGSSSFEPNNPETSFFISNQINTLSFSVIWRYSDVTEGRHVNVQVSGGGVTKTFEFEDHHLILPDIASIGYIEASPTLELGNKIRFFVRKPIVLDSH